MRGDGDGDATVRSNIGDSRCDTGDSRCNGDSSGTGGDRDSDRASADRYSAGNRHGDRSGSRSGYHRGQVTWTVFGMLLAFGVLNAGLGPALPFLQRAEHISYLASVLHQVAFAVGGGLAGLLTAHVRRMPGRALAIRAGLLGAAMAWLLVGYGNRLPVTVCGAFLVSALATTALIRLWAVLADIHGERRVVAMSEGEVAVSLGGIISPLLVSAMAATVVGWRGAFALGTALICLVVAATAQVRLPPSHPDPLPPQPNPDAMPEAVAPPSHPAPLPLRSNPDAGPEAVAPPSHPAPLPLRSNPGAMPEAVAPPSHPAPLPLRSNPDADLRPHRAEGSEQARRPSLGRAIQPTLLTVGAIVALEFALTFWLASYLGDSVGIPRRVAAAMVSALYLGNLAGRLLASWLAHHIATQVMLAGALVLAMAGLPILLLASDTATALIGLAIIGIGVGATFPLTSAMHVAASPRTADRAVGQVLVAASVGQIIGPVIVAALAQAFGLRVGMSALLGFALIALVTLRWHVAATSPTRDR